MSKNIIIRDDGSIRDMLDDINSKLPFKTTYSELIRSIVKSSWDKFNEDLVLENKEYMINYNLNLIKNGKYSCDSSCYNCEFLVDCYEKNKWLVESGQIKL